MPTSKRETILATVKTALAGTSNVSTRIYRSRVEALQRAETPALIIEPVNDTATMETTARAIWTLTFQVIVLVRANEPDSSGDATVIDVHSKIMSSATLLAMLVDLVPAATDFQFSESEGGALATITMQFHASYQTNLNDLTT